MKPIATFEKVSLNEYLKSRIKYDKSYFKQEEYYNTLVDRFTEEWENIKLPTRATDGSAGYDFYAPADYEVYSDNSPFAVYNEPIKTGIRCIIKPGWVLMLFPRSSLGFKHGLRLMNTVGIIDSDYSNADNEGHIMAKMTGSDSVNIKTGDRFMQGVFVQFGTATNDSEESMKKRTGGMGSTGT